MPPSLRPVEGARSMVSLKTQVRTVGLVLLWFTSLSVCPMSAGEKSDEGPPVIITEVLSHTDSPYTDAIELHNPTDALVEIGGWWISDSLRRRARFRIPDGTVIGPGDYLVYCQDSTGFPVLPCEGSYFKEDNPESPFSFGADGDDAYLFPPDPETCQPGDIYHGFEFGAAANEVSFGRHLTQRGEEYFPPQAKMTFGAPNSGPRIGPIVFSEILFQPEEEGGLEFVELVNMGKKTIHLRQKRKYERNTYRILGLRAIPGEVTKVNDICDEPADCEQFVFPKKTKIKPGRVILLIPETMLSEEFRRRYDVPDSAQTFRYSGRLQDARGSLRLVVPETFDGEPAQFFIELDRVEYGQGEPWPKVKPGFSLERTMPARYAGDPASWSASTVLGGSPGSWKPSRE